MSGDTLRSILDPGHPLLCLAARVDWDGLATTAPEASGGTRLMLGLQLLKVLRGLSDHQLCTEWVENPYFQAFCGMTEFRTKLPVMPSEMARWRAVVEASRLQAWIARSLPTTKEEPRTFVIDIDGVVAMLTPGNDYRLAQPIPEIVAAINRLYEQGHRIVMYTARGSQTGISWEELTRRQFEQWGLRFHELRFGKPAADYYVDDRLLGVDMMYAMSLNRPFPPSTCAPRLQAEATGRA